MNAGAMPKAHPAGRKNERQTYLLCCATRHDRSMAYERTRALFLKAEATDGLEIEWAWAIYRLPSRTLVLRSIPAYADCPQALAAGKIVAADIGRRLGILIVDEVG